jgi:5-methylcytosine-specific restriction endonuclease McrA
MVCQHCARAVRRRRSRHDIERDTIEIDHVIPLNLGGETTVANLVVSCMGCNRKRGGRGGD